MQSFLPLPQSASGVFQNLIDGVVRLGRVGVVRRARALGELVHVAQACLFTGVSPQVTACRACTFGVEMYPYHA